MDQIRRNDVHNCSSGWKLILQTRDLGMLVSIKEETFKLYTRNYNGFLWFITAFNISMDDPYAIEYYAAYLTIQGQTSRVEALRPSLQFWANIERRVFPISWSYDKIKRGITLIWSLIDRKALKRDPIFYHHIEGFIQRKDHYDPFIFKLTSAMLVIGFRLFARPGELARLKWGYVTKLRNGNIKLDLSGHKTDFFLLEKPITIDKHLENPSVCPVKLLFDYIDTVQHFKKADSPLFSLQDNIFFNTEDVSQLIKNAMFSVDSEITVSGHSLRIGATTESIIKGIPTQDIIMGTRHKDVKSLQPYQRQEALAARHLSTTLLSRDNIH
ncbi:predicted protein [Naegleria gruberi]|uniref:Predicted protein n=1 Tax=Naegleria gruberi TaxID=5762 RepID=D2V9E1_NAEGR|nr:uncharacterized protein NAEGRDRAFT_47676 [Naegleria gruberi]EFC46444.1 predicted protein [Naegleria gruberi]|eukprot:XP_002679188.1 predicted protein [Naegleria gruberi strain NEG-M]